MKIKTTKTITYRSTDSYGNSIPCIIIQGKFLTELGFKLGDKVKIDYEPGKILIYSIRDN